MTQLHSYYWFKRASLMCTCVFDITEEEGRTCWRFFRVFEGRFSNINMSFEGSALLVDLLDYS